MRSALVFAYLLLPGILHAAVNKSLEDLNHSLQMLAGTVRPSSGVVSSAKIPMEGDFDRDFSDVGAAFEAIKRLKDAGTAFRFNVVKKQERRPHWFITDEIERNNKQAKEADIELLKKDDPFAEMVNKTRPTRMIFMSDTYMGIFSTSAGTKLFLSKLLSTKDENVLMGYSTTTNTRILLIPRKTYVSIVDLGKDGLQKILKKVATIAEAFDSYGYELEINDGYPLQEVPHLHVHLTMYHQPFERPLIKVVEPKLWDGNLLWPKTTISKARGKS